MSISSIQSAQQTNNKFKTKTDEPMGYNWRKLKMKKSKLFLALFLATGFLVEEASYANNVSTNSVFYRKINEIISVYSTGRYRLLGQLKTGPYAVSTSVYIYTDGDYYYCSDFTINQVNARSEKELRESGVFWRIYKDNRGYYFNWYGDKTYLYNGETGKIVQNIKREVYYADWME